MKNCIKCGTSLNNENWYLGYVKISRYICKSCVNKQRRKEKLKNQNWISEEKLKTGCEQCGFKDHPAALCFHHIKPENKKIQLISSHPIKALKKELKKCIVLCFNCHQILHNS
ncbi:MAG: hypothetical protein DRO67_07410 [Candidatus Asgardarchaeum californiense]|nr:MAG: hypothetical protein DRO67_07410 [Candidatus Asgardarchaeum californiense]